MTVEEGQAKEDVFAFLAHEKPTPGQIEMIRESTEALRSGGYHLAAAPTGIGKTAADGYAEALVAEGFDTPVAFASLTTQTNTWPISIGLQFHSLCCDQRPDQALGAVLLVFART